MQKECINLMNMQQENLEVVRMLAFALCYVCADGSCAIFIGEGACAAGPKAQGRQCS